MSWPNNDDWQALSNEIVTVDNKDKYQLTTVDCGSLNVPSGRLICCDPFADMDTTGNPYTEIPKGSYPVVVTLADVSENLDGSHIREAYASLILGDVKNECIRKPLKVITNDDTSGEKIEEGEYSGFGVDAGTACFVDAESLVEGMPNSSEWYEGLFENDKDDSWFNQMDNPNLIREGIANIKLPLSKYDNNLILFHSGWGDGFYPIIGGYDSSDNLVAVHIDFFVVSDPEK